MQGVVESDVVELAKCSANLDSVEECLHTGLKIAAKELLINTIDRLLVIGDRHGLQLRLPSERIS